MKLSTAELEKLVDVAVLAVQKSGQMIARSRPTEVRHKSGATNLASRVVTEIDRRSEGIIIDFLTSTLETFDFGLLTEEQTDDGSRLDAGYFWCVDPLDGTLPFIEGKPGYAVSIALVASDGTPQLGAIYDPVNAATLHAIAGVGAFRNGRRWPTEPLPRGEVLSVFADRSFLTVSHHDAIVASLGQIAQELGLAGMRLETTAGAVMNACGVLAYPPACYFKFPQPTGGGSLWDFAATACVFQEVGAVATDFNGGSLDLNRADSTSMNHRGVLFATDQQLAKQLRALSSTR